MRFFFSFLFGAILFSATTIAIYAQPTDNFLQPDNIFDTLSVDLKVNGSDGPVNVAVGDRITISWESDGAKRCKGNWSKNDLRLNGKISGKLNRSFTGSVTVRIACIDADGNREDDSVVLKIIGSYVILPTTPVTPPTTPQPVRDNEAKPLPVAASNSVIKISSNAFIVYTDGPAFTMDEISRIFYQNQSDSYDFLGVLNLNTKGSKHLGNHYFNIRNNVSGIGRTIFDNGVGYHGSKEKLKGIGYLGDLVNYQDDKTGDQAFAYTLLEETLAHQFGVYVGASPMSISPLRNLQNPFALVHWNLCMNFPPPPDGYYYWKTLTWVDNKNGTWTTYPINTTWTQSFDPFMLYFMGVLPPEKVPTAYILEPDSGDEGECRYNSASPITIKAHAIPISIEDIITLHGKRVPSYEESSQPKDFNVALILVAQKDKEVPPSVTERLRRLTEKIPKIFQQATLHD